MRVLIVEDEPLAAERLDHMLKSVNHAIGVVGICSSVETAISWLESHQAPDLGFFDIQLGDGTSFDLFDKVRVTFPVVFTTAYDHFAIKAFKVNSVDYLLKPLEEEDLRNAIAKFEKFYQPGFNTIDLQNAVKTTAQMLVNNHKFKERFVVNVGEHIRVVKSADIACFYSEDKTTFLLTGHGRNYYLDLSLNQLEDQINPSVFFRTSRKEIVNLEYVSDIVNYGRSRLKVIINSGDTKKEVIVSRDRIKDFRNWLAQEHKN